MKLKSLHINRGYADDAPLRGEIVFKDEGNTEIKLPLDEQLASEIIALCAAGLVRAGRQAADKLVASANLINAIEHNPEGESDES